MSNTGVQQVGAIPIQHEIIYSIKLNYLLKTRKTSLSITYYFRALLKQFQLVTSISRRTLTDQIVQKYVRATLTLIVSTECTIVTIIKLKKLIFSSSQLSHFVPPEFPANLCFSSQVAGALGHRNLKPDKTVGLKTKFLLQARNCRMPHQVISYSQLIF